MSDEEEKKAGTEARWRHLVSSTLKRTAQRETLLLPPGFRYWCMGHHGNTTVEEVRRRHSNKTVHLSSPYLAPGHHVVGNLSKYDEEGTQRKLPKVEIEDNNSVYDAVGRYCLLHSMSATAVCGVRQPKPIKRSRGAASGPAKAAGNRSMESEDGCTTEVFHCQSTKTIGATSEHGKRVDVSKGDLWPAAMHHSYPTDHVQMPSWPTDVCSCAVS